MRSGLGWWASSWSAGREAAAPAFAAAAAEDEDEAANDVRGKERFFAPPERGSSDADASEDATPRAEAATVGLIMLSLRPRPILDLRRQRGVV